MIAINVQTFVIDPIIHAFENIHPGILHTRIPVLTIKSGRRCMQLRMSILGTKICHYETRNVRSNHISNQVVDSKGLLSARMHLAEDTIAGIGIVCMVERH